MHGICLNGTFFIITMEPRLILMDVKSLEVEHALLQDSPNTWDLAVLSK